MNNEAGWIAVDWGSSNLRAWLVGGDGRVVRRGINESKHWGASPDEFEAILLGLIGEWIPDDIPSPVDVVACGMIGSRQGWREAPYASVPTKPSVSSVAVTTNDPRINVWICAGVKQTDPADVMRGEETQIAGYVARDPLFDGWVVLPGTHSNGRALGAAKSWVLPPS